MLVIPSTIKINKTAIANTTAHGHLVNSFELTYHCLNTSLSRLTPTLFD